MTPPRENDAVDRYVPIRQAAELSGVPPRTLSRLAQVGRVEAELDGGRWRVSLADVRRYVRQRAARRQASVTEKALSSAGVGHGEDAGEDVGGERWRESHERHTETEPDELVGQVRARVLEAEERARLEAAQARYEAERRRAERARKRAEAADEEAVWRARIAHRREEIAVEAELDRVRRRSAEFVQGIAFGERRRLLERMVGDGVILPEVGEWYVSLPIDVDVPAEPVEQPQRARTQRRTKAPRRRARELQARVSAAREELERAARERLFVEGARREMCADEIDAVFAECVTPLMECLVGEAETAAEHGDLRELAVLEGATEATAANLAETALADYASGY